MTDAELLLRAMSAQRRVQGHGPNPRLRRLIRTADKYVGEPTDEEIRELAWRYYETPGLVRAVFETRGDRAEQRGSTRGRRRDAWIPCEDVLIGEMWASRDGQAIPDLEREIAAALTALPENRARNVRRTTAAAHYRRLEIGHTLSRQEMGKRRWGGRGRG